MRRLTHPSVLVVIAFAALSWVAVGSAGCLQLGLPQESDANAVGSTASAGQGGAAAVSGSHCGVDPGSGVALCLGISSCPSVTVDADQFPDCGFRISGTAIDLECLCGDSLCPMGNAASCAAAHVLLAEQSAQAVCAGVAEGRCRSVQTKPNTSGRCDTQCRAECSGVPGCLALCGC